jgi:Amt family ammonium transporter
MLLTATLIVCLTSFYVLLYLWRRRGEGLRDMLTGLPNRDYLERFVEHCTARAARRRDYAFGLVYLTINDLDTHRRSLGRFGLEEVLADVAERLYWAIRPSDVMARLDGDVFALVLDDVTRISDVTRVAVRVQRALDHAVSLAGRQVFVSASMGVTMSRQGTSMQDVMAEADAARVRCEEQQAEYVVFDDAAHRESVDALALETELSQAIEANQLRMGYQPVIDLLSETVCGFEALLEWEHPVRGRLRARDFVGIAERSGQIVAIGRWVLSRACEQLALWRDKGIARPVPITVNVCTRELLNDGFLQHVGSELARTGAPAASLVCELSVAVLGGANRVDVQRRVAELKALGVRVFADGFGVEPVSPAGIAGVGLDGIRLNATALAPGESSAPAARAVLRSIREWAPTIIVTGIERDAQLDAVVATGLPVFGQGYLFSPSVDAAAALDQLLHYVIPSAASAGLPLLSSRAQRAQASEVEGPGTAANVPDPSTSLAALARSG